MSVVIPLLVMGQAIVGGHGQSSAGDLDGYYNRRREVTFSGVVTGKTKGQAPGYAQGMSILVKYGRTIREVELGPSWYVGRQKASINLGDKVKVTGVPLVIDRRQRVVLARQIMRGRYVLALRDDTGMPYWQARRSTRVSSRGNEGGAAMPMDGAASNNMYQGTISSLGNYTVDGEQYFGYTLNTANGPMNVAVAPNWYWQNQNTALHIGDQLTLYGTGPISRLGNVTLANSFDYPGGTIFLRSPGTLNPFYGGFQPVGNGGRGGGAIVP